MKALKKLRNFVTFLSLASLTILGTSCEGKGIYSAYRTKPVETPKTLKAFKIEALDCNGKPFATHISEQHPENIFENFRDYNSKKVVRYIDTPLRVSDTTLTLD